ncbi:uncharacterized protein EV420DRAFT_384717 [Desarmillaria tabescens]|uniref:Uncharacterized protein n=1 Tax=Armillaria tabescens TaxID=1929756 RepID=A0AA39N5N6_ARMTA|nr:uncharacterized protein EV420DRAFT_384717 [Desarmillaria tabescens]KAK0458195.1 hypothetical protein EV420DRAFT_384717 [Desarmillaria tabescens]
MSTRSNTKKALEAARKAKIEEYYRDNALVDEAARIQHNDDIAEFSLFLDDKRNDITKNPDFRPFIRFIRRILVHVAASADQGSGTMGCYASVITRMARSNKGKEIWRTRWNDMALHPTPQILSYIQKSPPAIILGDTQRKRRAHIERYAWGYVDKENDVKEMFISRELVMAYIELEKSNACDVNADALVVLKTVILVVFIHELTHALTK